MLPPHLSRLGTGTVRVQTVRMESTARHNGTMTKENVLHVPAADERPRSSCLRSEVHDPYQPGAGQKFMTPTKPSASQKFMTPTKPGSGQKFMTPADRLKTTQLQPVCIECKFNPGNEYNVMKQG